MQQAPPRLEMKRWVQKAFLAFVALVSLQACDGCQPHFSGSEENTSGDGRPIEGIAPQGTYYRLVPGFTCSNQPHVYAKLQSATSGLTLETYNADCSPNTAMLASADVNYSPLSNPLVGYKGGIFQIEAQAPNAANPVEAFPEAWCRADASNGAVIDVSISRDPSTSNYSASVTGAFLANGAWQQAASEQQVVSRGALGTKMSYTSPSLSISADRATAFPNLNGTFTGTYAGKNLSFNLRCRFGQIFDPVVVHTPSLAFDLLAGALPSLMTFTRNGAGTYFDGAGLIQSAASNTPRFDHDPSNFAPLGLLVEEARTNLLTNASDLTAAGWTNSGIGVFASGTIAGLTSYQVIKNNPSDLEYWRRSLQSVNVTSGATYTTSFFVRAGNIPSVSVTMWQDATNYAQVDFNLSTATPNITYQNGVSVVGTAIVPVGSAYRVSVTFVPSAALMDVGVGPTSTTYNDYIFATGAQLEAGAGATSLILTASTPLTRGEDVARLTDMSWYSGAQGSFQIDASRPGFEANGGSSLPQAFALTGAGSDQQSIVYDVAGAEYRASITVGGVNDDWTAASTLHSGVSAMQDLLLAYEAGSASLQLNGSVTHDPGATPAGLTPNLLQIGGPSAAKWNAHFRSLSYWTLKFSDADLATLAH